MSDYASTKLLADSTCGGTVAGRNKQGQTLLKLVYTALLLNALPQPGRVRNTLL